MANGLRCLYFGGLGVLGIHGHPWLQNKFEASLSYMRPCLGKKEKKKMILSALKEILVEDTTLIYYSYFIQVSLTSQPDM